MNLQNTLAQAVALHQQGQLDDALKKYIQILNQQPRHVDALHLSGVVFHQTGQHRRAIKQIEQAVAQQPGQPSFHNNLGLCYQALEEWKPAEQQFEQAIALKADYPEALNNLGVVLRERALYQESRNALEAALKIRPEYAEANNNLGLIARQQGQHDEAIDHFKRATRLQPDLFQAQLNLGTLLFEKGDIFAAEPAFLNAYRLNPTDVEIILMLGNFSLEMGLLDKAIEWYRKGLEIDSEHPQLQSNYLFALNYQPDISQQQLFDHYRQWATRYDSADTNTGDFAGHDFDDSRRLTLAYLSADFRNHASSYFIRPLLDYHDQQRFRIIALSMSRQQDEVSAVLRTQFDEWIDIYDCNDDELEGLIRSQGVDILIDLAGHTRGQRLTVLARKPAPVQVSYLGYGYTTGLSQVDYFLADDKFVPPGDQPFFSEKIAYLDVAPFCYQPPQSAPRQPSPPPVGKNGFITFGCISRPVRINYRVIQVWARMLERIPQSRLRLDHPSFQRLETQQHFRQLFEQQGIEPYRLLFATSKPHWQAFDWIDILLDTFPHNSGTTTFESLWMGVPVITMKDRAPLGRFGDSLLHQLGFAQWVNENETSYIQCAIDLASDSQQLQTLRADIHQRFKESSLMDGETFTSHFEKALLKMWHECCRSHNE